MINKSKRDIIIRIATAILMFCFIMWGYWWMTWCLAIALLFYFPVYYEIILWGIIYDALYGTSLPEFWNIRYIFTILSIAFFILAFTLRKRLIVYDKN
ncbi:MAG: hypothetical protein Q7S72_01485 [Candidatus Taylorbacteria bacterium]|nr:hypothetical protein [Candidatus Taylorbacteria bacterium]